MSGVEATDRLAEGRQIEHMTIEAFFFLHVLAAANPNARLYHRKLHPTLRACGFLQIRPLYLDIDHAEQGIIVLNYYHTRTENLIRVRKNTSGALL